MFLKKKAALLASMLILNSWVGAVLATDSETLYVKAQIKPASCTVAFDGENTIDFGSISRLDIIKGPHVFQGKNKNIEVICNSPIKIKLSVVDDKINEQSSGKSEEFILTDEENNRKGYFSIQVDNSKNNIIASEDGVSDNSWSVHSGFFYLDKKNSPNGAKKYLSIYSPESFSENISDSDRQKHISPGAVSRMSIPLKIIAVLEQGSDGTGLQKISSSDRVSEIQKISGQATVTLQYM